jgi:hypothetical protein
MKDLKALNARPAKVISVALPFGLSVVVSIRHAEAASNIDINVARLPDDPQCADETLASYFACTHKSAVEASGDQVRGSYFRKLCRINDCLRRHGAGYPSAGRVT